VLPAEFDLPETFDVVTCDGCGMAYSDISGQARDLTATYRAASYSMHNCEDHERSAAADAELGSPLDFARLRVVAEMLGQELASRELRILDVGCASGTLLALLSAAGFSDVQGIDPSSSAVYCARRLGQRAWVGDLDAPLPAELGRFDVVILSHVLEHLRQPRAARAHLCEALRPGALVLYAEVPDAAR
jgi:2-polyprenyl-3-methyl-5-hydroxy-6-metoxy-1,4-benzoquinol methylase